MSLVFLEYGIMFNPDEAWQHVHQFEQSFGKFLDEIGFEANIISGPDNTPGKRILFITKKPEPAELPEEKKFKSKRRLKAMQMPRTGGKFDSKRSPRPKS